MQPLRRVVQVAAWTTAGLVYIWFAAVGNADRVRARKAERRRERLAGRDVRAG